MTRRCIQRGFTLIELIIVFVLLGMLAVMVVPMIASADDFGAAAAARMISSDIQHAQNHAIVEQERVTVHFLLSDDTYVLISESGPMIHPISNEAYVVDFDSKDEYAELDLLSTTFAGGDSVTFDELGSPVNSGSIVFCVGAVKYEIEVAHVTGQTLIHQLTP